MNLVVSGNTSTKLAFVWGNGSTVAFYEASGAGLANNTWYHVVGTRDSSGNTKLYVNGSQVTGSFVVGGASTAVYGSPQGLAIGRPGAYNGYYNDSKIDELGLWRRELTSAEMFGLYNSGVGTQYPFIVSTSTLADTIPTSIYTTEIQNAISLYFGKNADSSNTYVTGSSTATSLMIISPESYNEFASTTLKDAYAISKVFLATSTEQCVSNASTTECDKQIRKASFREIIKNLTGFIPSEAATEEFWMVHKGSLVLPPVTYASSTNVYTIPGYWKNATFLPTGGNVATSSQYRVHTFNSSGTFTIPFNFDVETLVVGGGGNGDSSNNTTYAGAGGGAGQVATSSSYYLTSSTFPVIVGTAGQASSFGTIIALGGSNGGNQGAPGGSSGNAYSGGASAVSNYTTSGGGAGSTGNGTPNNTYLPGNGGPGYYSSISGTSTCYAGGSGGGSTSGNIGGTSSFGSILSSVGSVIVNNANGGSCQGTSGINGTQSSITGVATYYGGAGGNGGYYASGGIGGLGGGGIGGNNASGCCTAPTSGTPNLGGGGGGGPAHSWAGKMVLLVLLVL